MTEGTPPERFAIEHAHYDEDLPFWQALAEEIGGPILDVGAAVGRVAVPLARAGHEVWALDGSEGMLATLTSAVAAEPPEVAARVHPVHQDFTAVNVPGRRFALAIMPMNSLQALLTRDEQLACLDGIRRHLAPGGVFAFDVVAADLELIAGVLGDRQPGVSWRDPSSGRILDRSATFDEVDLERRTVRYTAQIDERGADGRTHTYLRPHTVHIFTPTELWELLHAAGFEVQALLGDFDGSPFDDGAERQIYRCGVAT